VTFKCDILVSLVYKSHEQLHLGRHSQTQENFSYHHTKLVFDLLSYSFHPKIEHREETGGVNIQEMPLLSALNFSLLWQDNYLPGAT